MLDRADVEIGASLTAHDEELSASNKLQGEEVVIKSSLLFGCQEEIRPASLNAWCYTTAFSHNLSMLISLFVVNFARH